MKTREDYIDLAAGILIIWIMTFHALGHSKVFGDIDARVALPYLTFSLPWFFYKSGRFFDVSRGLDGIRKDAAKFLLPFLKWSAVGYLMHLAMMAIDGTFNFESCVLNPLHLFYIYGYILVNVPLWFVLSLFLVKTISYFLLRLRVHPILWAVIGFGAAFALHLADNPAIPVYCANVPMGIAFFVLGHLFSKYECKTALLVPCAVAYILFLIFNTPVVGLHRNVHLGGEYLLWPVFSYCGIVVFDNVCRWIRDVIDRFCGSGFRPVSFLGKNSMLLLVSHALIYQPVIHYSTLSPVATFCVVEALYFIILVPMVMVARK